WVRRDWRGHYRGQKQIWFLLRMVGRDCDVQLRATEHPEFDAWRWNDYWIPLDSVIEFKREVYRLALDELSRYLFRPQEAPAPRFLRGRGRRSRRDAASAEADGERKVEGSEAGGGSAPVAPSPRGPGASMGANAPMGSGQPMSPGAPIAAATTPAKA
ncbi:MAG TPA: hypothetical protein VN324_00535, partial [Quisquiliibacterium sp.]|nr:hypothetical protein [Quisquiliibacterium sp.]